MKNKVCKNKKCQRTLPEGYRHKFCENCRNERIKRIKDAGKAIASIAAIVGGTAITKVLRGKFSIKK